jgi:hypothetical protein
MTIEEPSNEEVPIETSPNEDLVMEDPGKGPTPPGSAIQMRDLPELKLSENQHPREARLIENSNTEVGGMRPFVQSFVANFLKQSLEEYLRSVTPSPPSLTTSGLSQYIPLYIQEMLHSVLQNYLVSAINPTILERASEIEAPVTTSQNQDLVPDIEEEEEIFIDKVALEYEQKLAEVTATFESRIAIYEAKLQELELNYHKLQKSSQETVSSQSRKILTLNELLSEKTAEIAALYSERQIQEKNDQETRREVDETMSLLNEELYGVRDMWKRMERVKEKEKRLLMDQLKEVQDDLTETVQYYQVPHRPPSAHDSCTFLSFHLIRIKSGKLKKMREQHLLLSL